MSEQTASIDAVLVNAGIIATNIVGMSHKPGARAKLAALPADVEFYLVTEPTNAYDPNAVKVMYASPDGEVFDLGFVKGATARAISVAVNAGHVVKVARRPESKSGSGINVFVTQGEEAQ